ncbi:hypothetical protein VP1G_08256 [Cytospora mali]|uniref:Uncharacterized protein n=1 Tax=Cytospora mali TaxID=578113 RepID=A0A194VB00_CYTMA|nr:hypothetical protein VP1G_08256 [Valsa mali var. pyri (nom. inval.)]
MEPPYPIQDTDPGAGAGAGTTTPNPNPTQPGHKRTPSGGGLLSRLSFMRAHSAEHQQDDKDNQSHAHTSMHTNLPRQPASIASALQEHKTRRRRGSLRKVALLGRGAQRERREAHRANLSIDVKSAETYGMSAPTEERGTFGLGISDITPRPSMDGYASRNAPVVAAASLLRATTSTTSGGGGAGGTGGTRTKPKVEIDEPTSTSPSISYTTTDDEDVLHIGRNAGIRGGPELTSLSSGADGYFGPLARRRTVNRARSPLSLSGLASTPLLPDDDDWDYTETEWWGWVILIVTWVVFVVGMGSCFGVWSWAWDVGTTPYAPPELEDDPTLPITGYYPALIILTCIMAWVWVVIAWVGMKYFRHAKISGD